MSELFKLKPCEECNGTGDAHHQGHDYDCPDCLGTGYEEPAKRIMNLELMLNQHKETLKSGDAYNNELAQKFEITLEQRDRMAVLLSDIYNYAKGKKPHDYSKLTESDRIIAAFDAWQEIECKIEELLQTTLTQPEPK